MSTNSAETDPLRPGELAVPLPDRTDARLIFIGRIHTPFPTRRDCPRQGTPDGPVCRLELNPPFDQALAGLERYAYVEVLYWMHEARRDLISQSPKSNGRTTGTFSLRSPLRPNPIGTAVCRLVGRETGTLLVRGLDCLDGTPLLDIKPYRGEFRPVASDKPVTGEDATPWCAKSGGT
jgi:tRNA-Thr(GGU) m(6)t(6)A37 methyltransferase TsaA